MGVFKHGVRNYTNASAVPEFCFLLALKIYRICKYTDLILLKIYELLLNCCKSFSSKFWHATSSQQMQRSWCLNAVLFLTTDFTSWNYPKKFPFPSTQIFKTMFWSCIYSPEIQFINTHQINTVFKTKRILKDQYCKESLRKILCASDLMRLKNNKNFNYEKDECI